MADPARPRSPIREHSGDTYKLNKPLKESLMVLLITSMKERSSQIAAVNARKKRTWTCHDVTG